MKDWKFNRLRIYTSLLCLFLAGFSLCSMAQVAKAWKSSAQPEKEIKVLRGKIKAPVFKSRDYDITSFGAKGDGKTLNTEAIKKAIEACSAKGGGRVIVPQGTFLTGRVYLKSNVNLYISEGSTLLFSRDPEQYPIVLTRWEGMECMNYSPFIYAYGEKNIGITGKGTIDGNADNNNWWNWNGAPRFGWQAGMGNQQPARAKLHDQTHAKLDARKRIYGKGDYLRPNFVQPYNCQNVVISGITVVNSPMWCLNPVLCENVVVEKVRVVSHGPNNDGCDPEACRNVLIKDCYFDTGDDCIAIKSGRDDDGRDIGRPAENHIIEGCTMKAGHGGVVIGSEISGGARYIYALNCIMDSPELDRVLRIKTSSARGGVIENVFMKNVKVGTYKEAAVKCNMFYEQPGNYMPAIRNVWVENMSVEKGGKYALLIAAYKESPVTNIRMVNCVINGVEIPYKVDNVKGLDMQNVVINGSPVTLPENIKNTVTD